MHNKTNTELPQTMESTLNNRITTTHVIYCTELDLNKANSFDSEAPFIGLGLVHNERHRFIQNYDKRDDINFEKVLSPFLDGNVPCSTLGLISAFVISTAYPLMAKFSNYCCVFHRRIFLLVLLFCFRYKSIKS